MEKDISSLLSHIKDASSPGSPSLRGSSPSMTCDPPSSETRAIRMGGTSVHSFFKISHKLPSDHLQSI